MRGERQALRQRLWQIAGHQHGYFSAAQALDVGYSYQAQKFHVDAANWDRVDRGLFRLPEWPIGQDDHLVRWDLWSRGEAVVSHATALAAHDIGDVDQSRVHLTVPPGFRKRHPEGLVLHHAVLPVDAIEGRDGYRVTTAARTIADCAAAHMDQQWLASAVADALDQGLTTARALRDTAAALGATAELGVERSLAAASR